MNPYLTDLIRRMQDDKWRDGMTSSEELPSWKATCEAETLNEISYITDLHNYIESENDPNCRKEAYFILAKIAENTNDENTLQFIINRLAVEKSNEVIFRILGAIQSVKKSKYIDIQPIINIIKYHKSENSPSYCDDESVKNNAIFALRNTENTDIEPLIISIIEQNIDNHHYQLWYAMSVLESVGTELSFPIMEKLAGHKASGISNMALFYLIDKGDTRQIPIFEKYISQGRNKDVALYALTKVGNETHIPMIIKRIKEVLSRKRSQEILIGDLEDNRTEITHGLEFLQKYADKNAEIPKLFDLIKTKKWEKLFDSEKKFFG